MEDNKIKNFSLAKEEIKFKRDELIFLTSFNKTKSMLGLSYGEKINQVHQRQREFVDNIRRILVLNTKKKFVNKKRAEELDEVISQFKDKNKEMFIEVSKFKVAAKLEGQPEIENLEAYEELVGYKSTDNVDELMQMDVLDSVHQEILNQVILENPELFSNFTGQAYIQSTSSSFIAFISPILKAHGYRLNRIKEEKEIIESK